jgi:hypothetical protein
MDNVQKVNNRIIARSNDRYVYYTQCIRIPELLKSRKCIYVLTLCSVTRSCQYRYDCFITISVLILS